MSGIINANVLRCPHCGCLLDVGIYEFRERRKVGKRDLEKEVVKIVNDKKLIEEVRKWNFIYSSEIADILNVSPFKIIPIINKLNKKLESQKEKEVK